MKRVVKDKIKRSKLYSLVKGYRILQNEFRKMIYPITLYRANVNRKKPNKIGISEGRIGGKRIIVSLTTFPERIQYVHKTIYSILNQSYHPNMIILWLAKEQFPGGIEDLPKELTELQKYGLTIEWVEYDWKSYKKIIPALLKYPNDIIVTADDDLYYPEYWLKSLFESYKEFPDQIHGHLSTKVTLKENEFVFTDRYFQKSSGISSFNNKILGGSGTLFPPNTLFDDVTDSTKFISLAPTNDDIWLWAMALKKGTKVRWIHDNMPTLYYVEGTQENTPCLVNENNHGENKRQSQTKAVFDVYQLYDLLREMIES